MKLREMEMVNTIKMKTQLKEMRENERLTEERKRIETLKKQRSELEQSLFKKETIISRLDNETARKHYHHVNKEEAKDDHKMFMIKPNVPKSSD
ncbi:hypothetical protein DPMN_070711 [Dreissena polymorpha]|uniref:Uncharacterized protein n=1 Tax=Dreissena polymorpha TaxID=45954 RepID=A0A9D3Z6N8_DREPO|nr:hypothetical protein DPMN_070711 [Dreissena polymorpha]